MTIAVQNHHDVAVHTSALLELLHDVDRPNCKLGFDAWSPALRGENLYEAARQAAPHTAITTNADYMRLPQYRYRPELVNYEPTVPDLVRRCRLGRASSTMRHSSTACVTAASMGQRSLRCARPFAAADRRPTSTAMPASIFAGCASIGFDTS